MTHEWRCLACGKSFKYESDFDKHKGADGDYLTDAEMRQRNMVVNRHGDWVTPRTNQRKVK